MDEDTAEKAKARRHQRILLVCVAIGMLLPLVAFVVVHVRAGS